MDRRNLSLSTKEQLLSTTSKGNQEKWYDPEENVWYKADTFGWEALAEGVVSTLLIRFSNVEREHGIPVVQYGLGRRKVHGHERIVSISKNFLQEGQSIVTLHRLLSTAVPGYGKILAQARSLPEKVRFLVDTVEAATGMHSFGPYLTLLFEVDALVLNTDRHLNNIAVLRTADGYRPCPVFDSGAALLLDQAVYPLDVDTKALIRQAESRPFQVSFGRLTGAARRLYGPQLRVEFSAEDVRAIAAPLLVWYPAPLRDLVSLRIGEILMQEKKKYFEKTI